MNKEDFKELAEGDKVSHKNNPNILYTVHNNYGDTVIAIKQIHMTNPGEWDLKMKVTGRCVIGE